MVSMIQQFNNELGIMLVLPLANDQQMSNLRIADHSQDEPTKPKQPSNE
jgi:hypothetical protein